MPNGPQRVRLYQVTVHAPTTKVFVVPKYEIGAIRVGWRGVEIEIAPLADVRDLHETTTIIYRRMINTWGQAKVLAFYPSPERLEEDIARAVEDTAVYEAEQAKLLEQRMTEAKKAQELDVQAYEDKRVKVEAEKQLSDLRAEQSFKASAAAAAATLAKQQPVLAGSK